MTQHTVLDALGFGALLQIILAVFIGIRVNALIEWLSDFTHKLAAAAIERSLREERAADPERKEAKP